MNILEFLFSNKTPVEQKGLTRSAVSMETATAQFSPRDYESFSKQAYMINTVAFKAISLTAKAAATIPLKVMEKRGKEYVEIENQPINDLLKNPNPMQSQSQFFEAAYSYYQISGNNFTEKCTSMNGKPMEIWSVNPQYLQVVPGKSKLPSSYIFKFKGTEIHFPVDPIKGTSDMLHVKSFHPLNHWWGMSALEAALYSIDQHNAAGEWNLALLQNGARPSGALKVPVSETNSSGTLSDEQYENLKSMIRKQNTGQANAGKTLLLEGGLEWQEMGMSLVDIAWIEGKNCSAREIALALGMPPILLSIPGDSTFKNYETARMALYEESVIPLCRLYLGELSRWLSVGYRKDYKIVPDLDKIEALAPKRKMKFAMIKDATWMLINEKRKEMGLVEIDGLDLLEPQLFSAEKVDAPKFDYPIGQTKTEELDPHEVKFVEPSEIKQVNPITKSEKKKVFAQINQQRNFFAKSFEQDLKEIFENLAADLGGIEASSKIQAESSSLRILDSYNSNFEKVISKHIRRSAEAFGENIIMGAKSAFGTSYEKKNERQFSGWVEEYVEERTGESVTNIQGTNEKQIRKAIRDAINEGINDGLATPKIAERIRESMGDISKARSIMIARTEIGMASNNSSLAAAKSLGVPNLEKEWISAQDQRTRPGDFSGDLEHPNHLVMNGVKVDQDAKFLVPPGDEMSSPGDSAGGAGQVINCRCVMTFGLGN